MRFLMVDRVTEFSAGERLKAVKNVTMDASYLEYHFPSQPVFPGVLMTEAMAQASGYLIMRSVELQQNRSVFAIMTANNSRFMHLVRPGDQLVMSVELTLLEDQLARTRVHTHVGERLVGRSDITMGLTDYRAGHEADNGNQAKSLAERAINIESVNHWHTMRRLLNPDGLTDNLSGDLAGDLLGAVSADKGNANG